LKSIKNIQKITKSMKMVAAAKYARAERQLKPARVYGTSALGNDKYTLDNLFIIS
jgi:F-type H+-transporting ATPase subunit gamma